jgi:hypothetical protein
METAPRRGIGRRIRELTGYDMNLYILFLTAEPRPAETNP